MQMSEAWIEGRSVALDVAVVEAAAMLRASHCPVIAGLGTDVAGARAAVALAERVGGVVDHMHADHLLRDLDVLREAGVMVTTPNEARLRGDTILLVGSGLVAAWPDLADRLLQPRLATGETRRIFWVCPGRDAKALARDGIVTVGRGADQLIGMLALLRARIAGRPAGSSPKGLDRLAAELAQARFGVAVWSGLDPLAGEMLSGLVGDLNAGTRFSGLPLAPPDNAMGVMQACGWMTGFPVRTGFARGYPEHDPWRFDAQRLVDSGEADCAVWISAYRAAPPPWSRAIPLIALTGPDARFRDTPRVRIVVGEPGVAHDAVDHSAATGTLTARDAARRSEVCSTAQAVARIAAAMPGVWPC
jgi:formylmethanofuran dehydrogenase subunit B